MFEWLGSGLSWLNIQETWVVMSGRMFPPVFFVCVCVNADLPIGSDTAGCFRYESVRDIDCVLIDRRLM